MLKRHKKKEMSQFKNCNSGLTDSQNMFHLETLEISYTILLFGCQEDMENVSITEEQEKYHKIIRMPSCLAAIRNVQKNLLSDVKDISRTTNQFFVP